MSWYDIWVETYVYIYLIKILNIQYCLTDAYASALILFYIMLKKIYVIDLKTLPENTPHAYNTFIISISE